MVHSDSLQSTLVGGAYITLPVQDCTAKRPLPALLRISSSCRRVDSSIGHNPGDPQGGAPGQQHAPFSSMTLQTAPLLAPGTTWTVNDQPGPGAC